MSSIRRLIRITTVIIIAIVIMAGLCVPGMRIVNAETEDGRRDGVLELELTYSGNEQPEETFEIEITPKDESGSEAPAPAEGWKQSVTMSNHKTTDIARFTFSFPAEGTYTYEVRQTVGNTEGVTYDTSSYTVVFTAYYNQDSIKSVMSVRDDDANESKPDGIKFRNSYSPNSIVTDDPPVRKVVIGTDAKDPFVFIFKRLRPDFPMPAGSNGDTKEVTVYGSGEIEFGDITFAEPGIFEYEVTERNDKLPGYIYDKTVYHVVYTVERAGNGLTCQRVFMRNDSEISNECVFTNRVAGDDGNDDNTDDSKPGILTRISKAVKTGDVNTLIPYALGAILSLLLIVIFIRVRRNNER